MRSTKKVRASFFEEKALSNEKEERTLDERAADHKVVRKKGIVFALPEDLDINEAIRALEYQRDAEDSFVDGTYELEGYPFDAAVAIKRAIDNLHGMAIQRTKISFSIFGVMKQNPSTIAVRISPTETVQVPWGEMELPGMPGSINIQPAKKGERWILKVYVQVQRKFENQIKEIIKEAQRILDTASIYKGQALRFVPSVNSKVPSEPEFLAIDPGSSKSEELILNSLAERQLQVSVFTPIEKSEACRARGIPLRRGVMLEGPFGTGKTLAAYKIANRARANGWTFLYVEKAEHLAEARLMANRFTPCVIFVEDIDQVATNAKMSEQIRNTVDGIDTKDQEVMLVCTTNRLGVVKKHMAGLLRPGRLDSIISIHYPDVDATKKLLRQYGQGLIPDSVELTRAAEILANQPAATIREAVERAKLHAVDLDCDTVSEAALVEAAEQLAAHVRQIGDDEETPPSLNEQWGNNFRQIVAEEVETVVQEYRISD